jgi:hypothetical protein
VEIAIALVFCHGCCRLGLLGVSRRGRTKGEGCSGSLGALVCCCGSVLCWWAADCCGGEERRGGRKRSSGGAGVLYPCACPASATRTQRGPTLRFLTAFDQKSWRPRLNFFVPARLDFFFPPATRHRTAATEVLRSPAQGLPRAQSPSHHCDPLSLFTCRDSLFAMASMLPASVYGLRVPAGGFPIPGALKFPASVSTLLSS